MNALLLTPLESARRWEALRAFRAAAHALLACPVCRRKVRPGALLRELDRLERELTMAEALGGVLRQESLLLASPN